MTRHVAVNLNGELSPRAIDNTSPFTQALVWSTTPRAGRTKARRPRSMTWAFAC